MLLIVLSSEVNRFFLVHHSFNESDTLVGNLSISGVSNVSFAKIQQTRRLLNARITDLRISVTCLDALKSIRSMYKVDDKYESNGVIKLRFSSAIELVAKASARNLVESLTTKDFISLVRRFLALSLPSDVISSIFAITSMIKLFESISDLTDPWSLFVAKAKALTLVAKHYQSVLSPYWRFLVDLDLIAAFQVKKHFPDSADIFDWLSVSKNFSNEYHVLFDECLSQYSSELSIIPPKNGEISPQDFVNQPYLWATSGSSISSPKVENFRKTKWSLYYSDPARVLDYLLHSKSNILVPFVKPDEPLKSRFIVNGDDPPFIKMAYEMFFISPTIENLNRYPTFMTNSQYINMVNALIFSMDTGLVNLDLDQHSFDHFPSKRMVMGVVSVLNAVAVKNATFMKSILFDIGCALLQDFENMDVVFGNIRFKWNNGVASGWRWTALIDTIINEIECRVVDLIVRRLFNYGVPVLRFIQGDDVTERYTTSHEAQVRLLVWQMLGFDISVPKTLIATRVSEFLRYTFGNSSMSAYPSRMLHTMFVAYSETSESLIAERATVVNYLQYCSRANVPINDRLLSPKWRSTLHTSTMFGGFGVRPICSSIGFLPSVIKIKRTARFFGFELQRLGQKEGLKIRSSKFSQVDLLSYFVSKPQEVAPFPLRAVYLDADAPYRAVELFRSAKDQVKYLVAWLTPQHASLYHSIAGNFTLRMLLLWLYGKLPTPTSYYEYNPRLVEIIVSEHAQRYLGLVRHTKVTFNMWFSWMLWLEENLSKYISDYTPYHLVV